jgi:hypothetical protein
MAAPLFEFRDDVVIGTQPSLYAAHGRRPLDILLGLFRTVGVVLRATGV